MFIRDSLINNSVRELEAEPSCLFKKVTIVDRTPIISTIISEGKKRTLHVLAVDDEQINLIVISS